MGLDWIVQAKAENGRTVEPGETAGERPATKSDPETVQQFRAYYDEVRSRCKDPGPPPVMPAGRSGLGALFDFVSRTAARRKRAYEEELAIWNFEKQEFDDWSRPFEELLDQYVAGAPPILPPENRAALARMIGELGGFYDFRRDVLREDQNDVSAFATEALGMDYPILIYGDSAPDEMLDLADDLEKALAAYRASDREQDEESIEAVEAAVPWLRFWASKGHSFVADF